MYVFLQSASEQKTEMEKIKHRIAEEATEIEERKRKIENELKEVQVKVIFCGLILFHLLRSCHMKFFPAFQFFSLNYFGIKTLMH